MMKHKFNYNWTLKDANFTKDKGKVFSCFACGGGSTMGYKLAGFDVIGHNDIDKKMIEVYKENHKPKFSFLESITTFAKRKDLPSELYNLDILDGSPPCSSFSSTGNRELDWGKEKIFKEGQSKQVLDTLFFDFIDLAKELQPKVVVAENVEGLLLGNSKSYVRKIYAEFDKTGYYCQHFLLDSKNLGVPQQRKRVFFICLRKDLAKPFLYQKDMFTVLPKIDMVFKEKIILLKEFIDYKDTKIKCTDLYSEYYDNSRQGKPVGKFKTVKRESENKVAFTQVATNRNWHPTIKREMNDFEVKNIASYPQDYESLGIDFQYLCGMSVPPLMTAQVASNIYEQWLSKL